MLSVERQEGRVRVRVAREERRKINEHNWHINIIIHLCQKYKINQLMFESEVKRQRLSENIKITQEEYFYLLKRSTAISQKHHINITSIMIILHKSLKSKIPSLFPTKTIS